MIALAVLGAAAVGAAAYAAWFYLFHCGWRVAWERAVGAHGKPVLRRRLCQMERAYGRWAWSFRGANRVGIAASLRGRHSLDALCEAARRMEARHPMVRAVLLDWSTLECPATGSSGALRVSHVDREDAGTWEAVWGELECKPCARGEGFFAAVLVSREGEDEFEVVLAGHHLACDGVSILHLMHELLASLDDPDREWSAREAVPPATTFALEHVQPLRSRVAAIARYITKIFSVGLGIVPAQGLAHRQGATTTHPGKPSWAERAQLDEAAMSALARRAKAVGIGLNAVVTAAAGQAVSEMANEASAEAAPHTVAFNVPVNLRPRHAKLASSDVGCHIASLALLHEHSASTRTPGRLWEAAAALHAKTYAELAPDNVLPLTLCLLPLYLVVPAPTCGMGANSIIVSNWGRTPFPRAYPRGLEVLGAKPLLNVHVYNQVYFNVTCTNGKLDLAAMGSPRVFSQDQLRRFVGLTARFLLAMADQGA